MTIDKTQYREDAKGNLVPLASIREIDLLRDELVTEIASKACAVQDNLIEFKRRAMDDIAAFVQLSADRYDVKVGGKKGFQLTAARRRLAACLACAACKSATFQLTAARRRLEKEECPFCARV